MGRAVSGEKYFLCEKLSKDGSSLYTMIYNRSYTWIIKYFYVNQYSKISRSSNIHKFIIHDGQKYAQKTHKNQTSSQ